MSMPRRQSHPRSAVRAALPWLVLMPLLAVAAPGAPAVAQSGQSRPQVSGVPGDRAPAQNLQVYAYTLRHKPASEALMLIRPLLTSRGTLELQPEGNTLVVRDTLAALGRIVPTLRAYDQPPAPLRMHVMVVRADSRPSPSYAGSSLPDWLEERLRGLLRWDYYRVLADSGVQTREGESVTHEVGLSYGVSFRMGNVLSGDRIKLHDFKVWRAGTPNGRDEPLVEATLNLSLDKPKVLGLANSESSDHALMVVLTCERLPQPRENMGGYSESHGGRCAQLGASQRRAPARCRVRPTAIMS
jgi:hypothetical protein